MISIIGAGPSGSYLAYLLAKAGKEVSVFEEHKNIGKPVQCTGLVTSSINGLIHLKDDFIINRISKVKVVAPNNDEVIFELHRPNYVFDRMKFDEYVASLAMNEGARYFFGKRFVDFKNNKMVFEDKEEIETDYLVGADGPLSKVAKCSGMFNNRKFMTGMQARVKGRFYFDTFVVYLGKGYFGWSVPENEKFSRIGVIASDGKPRKYFASVLKRAKGKIVEYQSGLIPLYQPNIICQMGNVFLVGDAATQCKGSSLERDESIIIKKNSLMRNVKIGEFVDELMAKNKNLVLRDGKIGVLNLNENIYALSPDKKCNEIKFRRISKIIRHEINDNLFEVVTQRGYSVKVTGSHSVMVFSKNGFVEKNVFDLTKKDFLVINTNKISTGDIDKINLAELIINEAPELIGKIKIKDGKQLLFKNKETVPKIFRRTNFVPLNYFLDKGKIPRGVKLCFSSAAKVVEIDNIIKIDHRFCRLMGYYTAEGGCERRVTLSFGVDDIKRGIVGECKKYIKEVFGVTPQKEILKINKETGKLSSVNLSFGGNLLALIFDKVFKAGVSSWEKQIPFIIFNLSTDKQLEYLKSYLRGDGHVRVRMPTKRRNWSAEISCQTVSRKLVGDIISLSNQIGLFPSSSIHVSKSRRLYGQKIRKSRSYKITFSSKNDLEILFETFAKKKKDFKKYLKKIKNRSVMNLPREILRLYRHKLHKKLSSEFGRGYNSPNGGYKSYSYNRLLGIITHSKDPEFNFLKNVIKNKMLISPIREINKIKIKKDFVYDVEISQTQMFLGGVGNILLHNTHGGIIQGMIAGSALCEALVKGKSYDKLWRKRLRRDLYVHLKIREKLDKMSNNDLNYLVKLAKQEKIKKILEAYDRDFASKIAIKVLLKEPRFLKLAF